MKKTTVALTITAFVLLLLGVGYIVGQVFLLPTILSFDALYSAGLHPIVNVWFNFLGNSTYDLIRIVVLSAVGVLGLIIPIIWIILLAKGRKPASLLVLLTWILVVAVVLYDFAMLHPFLFGAGAGHALEPYFGTIIQAISSLHVLNIVIMLLPHVLIALALLFAIAAMIVNMIDCVKSPLPPRRKVKDVVGQKTDDHVILVREEPQPAGPSADEIREIIREEVHEEPAVVAAAAPPPVTHEPVKEVHAGESIHGLSGPLIVQYINTYGQPQEQPKPAPAPAPVVVEKIDYDKIRGLIREELFEYLIEDIEEEILEEPVVEEPVVEEPTPEVVHVGPTLDEIREMVREEVLVGAKDKDKGAPIIVTVPTPKPAKDPLTPNQVKALIATELGKLVAKERKEEKVEVAPAPAPVVEQLDEERVRHLIAGELAKLVGETEKKNEIEVEESTPSLTKDEVRAIIEEALEKKLVVKEVIREVVKEKPVAAKPVAAPVKVSEPAVVKPPVAKPKPKAQPRPAAVNVPRKYERIPFQTRMKGADKEMKANYNELKSEILSYGVRSRVSNTGDTFRLRTKTYIKITIAGKSLKLYFALDPKAYERTTLPVQDASHIGIYQDIPLIFKVKSPLSMRRAKQLIADVMEADNLEQSKIEPHNWVKEI